MEKKSCRTCHYYYEKNKKITRGLGAKGYCKKLSINQYSEIVVSCEHWLDKKEGKEEQRILDRGW